MECPGRQLPAPNSKGKVRTETARPCVSDLGAWFADDLDQVVETASAVVTHAHSEAVAGAELDTRDTPAARGGQWQAATAKAVIDSLTLDTAA
jgi:hypothetical protein